MERQTQAVGWLLCWIAGVGCFSEQECQGGLGRCPLGCLL